MHCTKPLHQSSPAPAPAPNILPFTNCRQLAARTDDAKPQLSPGSSFVSVLSTFHHAPVREKHCCAIAQSHFKQEIAKSNFDCFVLVAEAIRMHRV
jgi:hypothetical protein